MKMILIMMKMMIISIRIVYMYDNSDAYDENADKDMILQGLPEMNFCSC